MSFLVSFDFCERWRRTAVCEPSSRWNCEIFQRIFLNFRRWSSLMAHKGTLGVDYLCEISDIMLLSTRLLASDEGKSSAKLTHKLSFTHFFSSLSVSLSFIAHRKKLEISESFNFLVASCTISKIHFINPIKNALEFFLNFPFLSHWTFSFFALSHTLSFSFFFFLFLFWNSRRLSKRLTRIFLLNSKWIFF